MNECSICKKAVPEGATHCSIKCLNEAHFQGIGRVAKARNSFVESMNKMLKMEVEPAKVPEPATVVVTHKGRHGKGEIVGNTVLRFNDMGEARVPFLGYVMEDVETFVKHSKGLATYRIEQPISLELPVSEIPIIKSPVIEIPIETLEISTEKQDIIEEPINNIEDEILLAKSEGEVTLSVYDEDDEEDQPIRRPVRPPKRK